LQPGAVLIMLVPFSLMLVIALRRETPGVAAGAAE